MSPSVHHQTSPAASSESARPPAMVVVGHGDTARAGTAHTTGGRPSGPPPGHGAGGTPAPDGGDRKERDSALRSLSPTSLLAGGAAAATASVVGGHLGVAGTVIGAALTSVISAGAVAIYTDSVKRSAAALKTVQRVTTRRGRRQKGAAGPTGGTEADSAAGAAPTGTTDASERERSSRSAEDGLAVLDADGRPVEDDARNATRSPRRRWTTIAATTLAMGLIGLAAVFGVQRAIGVELSPGTGEIQRSVTGSDAVQSRTSSDDSGSTDDSSGTGDDGTSTDGTSTDGTDEDSTSTDSSTTDGTSTDDPGSGSSTDGSSSGSSSTDATGTDDSSSGSTSTDGSGTGDSSSDSSSADGSSTDSGSSTGDSGSSSSTDSGSGAGSSGSSSSSGSGSSGSSSSGSTQDGSATGSGSSSGTAAD
ncbi:hypothetical protein NLU66_00865 [Brachybacterium sp. NBEC-018]|uniref:hypothetical protein n=1 Tax=Brachybacterium sp. NBEC-018 TaxID=2996004 RepID=UPI0021753C56|nr:hypothetical protein [Brachybacterium sp. NBEC-018]UVY84180.1 hypothetical protein NLU66_00865 [Brachybacterium sp. NBEC-018]